MRAGLPLAAVLAVVGCGSERAAAPPPAAPAADASDDVKAHFDAGARGAPSARAGASRPRG